MISLPKIISLLFITIALISLNSCRTIDYVVRTEYIYNNKTSQNILLKLLDTKDNNYKSYEIGKNTSLQIKIESEGEKGIIKPFGNDVYPSKIVLVFIDENECITFENGNGLLNFKEYDNYTSSMLDSRNNTLIYNIDDVELNLANACQ